MSLGAGVLMEFADKFSDLVRTQSEWSQATFGTDAERGPIGPLKHLEKEAREARANPSDIKEHADILILWLDASRRAGFKPMEVVEAALAKMEENKARTWPPKGSMPDEAVEHVREPQEDRRKDNDDAKGDNRREHDINDVAGELYRSQF
jgi:hypothetical protein